MDSALEREICLHDFKPSHNRFYTEVLSGLRKPQKELPSKYFYDEWGSQLFECICTQEEYYIPRIEASIIRNNIEEIVELIGLRVLLVEYGSGNCKKVRDLLDHLHDPVAYVPIDISREQLLRRTQELSDSYPKLEVLPVCADYMSGLEVPVAKKKWDRVVVYFPGSTISNFNSISAKHFLENIANVCGSGGALLIGVDLKKDPAVLHSAYNDKEGVTAAFNLNILERINRELNCDFKLEWFQHYAFYNPWESRIEMHLISQREQSVHLDNFTFHFTKGESIWTESSYKFTVDEFAQMAATAGFKVERVWTDERQWFSVQYLVTT